MTARQADLAATFNYASQAHNNHFFFEALVSHCPVGYRRFFVLLTARSRQRLWRCQNSLLPSSLTLGLIKMP